MQKLLAPVLMAAALSMTGTAQASVETLRMTCGPTGPDRIFCDYVATRFEKETGNKLETVEWPFSSTDQLSLLQQMFSAREGTIDVMQLDVVWPGLLGCHLLDLSDHFDNDDGRFFEAQWDNNIVDGKLKAVAAFVDAAMLYYRTDLLEKYDEQPPVTWDDMERIANKIQEAERKRRK